MTTVDVSNFIQVTEETKNQLKDWFGNALTFSEFDEYWWVETTHKMIKVSPDILMDVVYGDLFDIKLTKGMNHRCKLVLSMRY